MEIRKAKVICSTPGGTAGKNSECYRISLPTGWVKKLGADVNSMEVELQFDGETITIRQKQTAESYIKSHKAAGHILKKYCFYSKDILCTVIYADHTDYSVFAQNHTDKLILTAFGRNQYPTWEDFLEFVSERCIPRTREGIREWLEANNIDEYDPFQIILRTEGRMAEDYQWLSVEEI